MSQYMLPTGYHFIDRGFQIALFEYRATQLPRRSHCRHSNNARDRYYNIGGFHNEDFQEGERPPIWRRQAATATYGSATLSAGRALDDPATRSAPFQMTTGSAGRTEPVNSGSRAPTSDGRWQQEYAWRPGRGAVPPGVTDPDRGYLERVPAVTEHIDTSWTSLGAPSAPAGCIRPSSRRGALS